MLGFLVWRTTADSSVRRGRISTNRGDTKNTNMDDINDQAIARNP